MIGFQAKVDKNKAEDLLTTTILKSLSGNELEVNGFKLKMTLKDRLQLNFDHKLIQVQAPFDIHVQKSGGLFSIEGNGSIKILIEIKYEISETFVLTTKTNLKHYDWITPPVIELGSLDIPVEKLMDLMLRHYDAIICADIDSSIAKNLNLKNQVISAIEQLKKILYENAFHQLRLYINPSEVLLEPIEESDGTIYLRGLIKIDAVVSDKILQATTAITLKWCEKILQDHITYVQLQISENVISDILCDGLSKVEYGGESLQTKSCKVDFSKDQSMQINIVISKPIEGSLYLKGIPKYNESLATLNVEQLTLDVKPSNFIYRLTSPLLERFLLSEIKNNLPVKIDEIIKSYSSSLNDKPVTFNGINIITQFASIDLKELSIDEVDAKGLIQIKDMNVEVVY